MSALLVRSSLRFMRHHPWQTWLTMAGIVLGVAVVVAVDLANASARRAFALSLSSVAGDVTHQLVGGPNGIDEDLYVNMRTTLGIQKSAPLVSARVVVGGETFTLLGVDPIAELALRRHNFAASGSNTSPDGAAGFLARLLKRPDAIVISARSAARLGLQIDDSLAIGLGQRQHRVTLVGIFHGRNPAATEGLLFMDIAAAQELLGRLGRIDRIDLILDPQTQQTLIAWMPDSLQLVDSEARSAGLRQMSEAFHTNLTAMSLLALLVGGLLIYNTMTFSVLQRRRLLGIYRAQGVTRREVFALVLAEALGLGAISSLMGVGLGLLLAQGLVQLVMRTVNELYFVLHVSTFFISPLSLLKGLGLGLGVTLLAAFLPALEAACNRPVNVQQRSVLERRWRLRLPPLLALGALAMVTGWGLIGSGEDSLVQGFAALSLVVFGFSLAVPFILYTLVQGGLLLSSSSIVRIGLRGINASASRTSMAVAALTVAVSATVGVGVMVHSFRHTFNEWLQQSLPGDIYLSSSGAAPAAGGLPPSLVQTLRRLPGVAAVGRNRMARVETEWGQQRLTVLDGDASQRYSTRVLAVKAGVENAMEAFARGEGILVSEPLAYHRQLQVGSSMRVHTDHGAKSLSVLGIFYDYTSSVGLIAMHRSLYTKLWHDRGISGLSVFVAADTSQSELLKTLRNVVGEAAIVRSNREIRDRSLAIFEHTFAITHILRVLVIAVAFIGIFSALMSVQLERLRELAILRVTGMTPAEVSAVVIGQAAVMGFLAALLALPLGLVTAVVLIDVVNLRSFGWSLQFVVPPGVLVEAQILSVTAALLAGSYPALKAVYISPAHALREE